MGHHIDISASKYDVEDITRYQYLDKIWVLLENTPDKGITNTELWEQTGLDPLIGNKLLKELQNEFQSKVLHNILSLISDHSLIVNSWAFDKVMLLITKIDTGNSWTLPNNPVFKRWIEEWHKKRGV